LTNADIFHIGGFDICSDCFWPRLRCFANSYICNGWHGWNPCDQALDTTPIAQDNVARTRQRTQYGFPLAAYFFCLDRKSLAVQPSRSSNTDLSDIRSSRNAPEPARIGRCAGYSCSTRASKKAGKLGRGSRRRSCKPQGTAASCTHRQAGRRSPCQGRQTTAALPRCRPPGRGPFVRCSSPGDPRSSGTAWGR